MHDDASKRGGIPHAFAFSFLLISFVKAKTIASPSPSSSLSSSPFYPRTRPRRNRIPSSRTSLYTLPPVLASHSHSSRLSPSIRKQARVPPHHLPRLQHGRWGSSWTIGRDITRHDTTHLTRCTLRLTSRTHTTSSSHPSPRAPELHKFAISPSREVSRKISSGR
jgi:hypothetical protein